MELNALHSIYLHSDDARLLGKHVRLIFRTLLIFHTHIHTHTHKHIYIHIKCQNLMSKYL